MICCFQNEELIELAKKCNVRPHCIAIGSYARKIVKEFLNKEIRVELTPYEQKIEDEINEFLYQEVTWAKIHDFLFQEISFGKKNKANTISKVIIEE